MFSRSSRPSRVAARKKTDVVEHPKALNHVGILFNGPSRTAELPFIKSSNDQRFAVAGAGDSSALTLLPENYSAHPRK